MHREIGTSRENQVERKGLVGWRSAARGWLTVPATTMVVAVVVATGWTGASASSAAVSTHLLRYPYVTEVVANSATLAWGTDRSQAISTAVWGAVVDGVCSPTSSVAATSAAITVGTTPEYQWRAELSFPASGTYCYRVLLGTTDLLGGDSSPQVSTAAVPGTPYSFAVVGDWGAGTTGEANVMSRIGQSSASFVVTAGDNVYSSGTDTEYGDLSKGNVFPPQYLPALHGRPVFATQGNHGFTTNLPYLQNFPAQKAALASGGRNAQDSYCCISTMTGTSKYASSWYAFDWGSARFYVLEAAWADGQGGYQGDFLAHWNGAVAGCAACGAEMTWLKADLAAHASTPIKFAFSHYPLHSDASGQSSDTYLNGPNGLEGVLANNNVGILFNGHAHQYERNYPQITGKPLVTYVTGNGGDSLGGISSCSSFDAYAIGSGSSCRAPKPTSDAQVFGFLMVSVQGSKVTVTPTDSTGATYDQQTYDYSSLQITQDTSAPTVPGGLTGTATSSTAATVSWSPSTDDTGVIAYDMVRNGVVVASVAGTSTSYSDTALTPATTYQYSVSARDAAGNTSGPSATVSITTASPPDDFSIAASPGSVAVSAGTLASTTVTTTVVAGSAIPLTLTASGMPGGTLVSFNPSAITSGGSSAVTIGTSSSTPVGTALITITATGSGISHTTTISLTVNPPPTTGPALIQSASATEVTSSTALTAAFTSASTAGHLLVLSASVYTGATNTITSVTDSAGDTWTRIASKFVSGHNSDGELWYSANTKAVASVTAHTASASTMALTVQEFSGVATVNALDVSIGASGTGTTANSGSITSTGANDLLVGFIAGHGSAQTIAVTSLGYLLQPQATSTGSIATLVSGYQVQGAPGPMVMSGTFTTAMYWAAGVAAFRAGS